MTKSADDHSCNECCMIYRGSPAHSAPVLDATSEVYIEGEGDDVLFHGSLAELLAPYLSGDALLGLVRRLKDRAAKDPSWPRAPLDLAERRVPEAKGQP